MCKITGKESVLVYLSFFLDSKLGPGTRLPVHQAHKSATLAKVHIGRKTRNLS